MNSQVTQALNRKGEWWCRTPEEDPEQKRERKEKLAQRRDEMRRRILRRP